MLLTMERMLKYFFLAGLVQYALYVPQYLQEIHVQSHVLFAEAKLEIISG
jgi:hypothetical protein